MDPAVGLSNPAIKPSSVDFPLPDGPVIATICFSGTSTVTSSRIVTECPPALRRIVRFRTAIMVSLHLRGARPEWRLYYTVWPCSPLTRCQIIGDSRAGVWSWERSVWLCLSVSRLRSRSPGRVRGLRQHLHRRRQVHPTRVWYHDWAPPSRVLRDG